MTRSKTYDQGGEGADSLGDAEAETMFNNPGPDEGTLAGVGGPASAPASFEVAMAERESLGERMEGGRLPLEDSLAAYQRGVVLVKFCREALGQVAQRVRILQADLLQPFDAFADEPDA